jgi:hypothetical protein
MKLVLLFLFLFCLLSCSIFSQITIGPLYIPQSYYVSPTGNDTNSGTPSSYPLATIHKALTKKDQSRYGMIINVMPGNYKQAVKIDTTGGPNYFIRIIATDTTNKPVFYGNDSTFIGKDAVFNWGSNVSYITLYGIKIKKAIQTDTLRGIWVRGDNNAILYCELDSLNRSGIVIQGNSNLIDHNYVHHVFGSNGKEGNNIDIETIYSGGSNRTRSDSNIVQFNTLTDNTSHFGINIFPFTTDSNQPSMIGNKIYNNFISNTGGGVYTRYQKNMEIINNVIVQNQITSTSQGGGILFDVNNSFPRYGDTCYIKIYNNTIADNHTFGFENNTSRKVYIKNNIFTNNGGWHIVLQNLVPDTMSHVDYNMYYTGSDTWKWGDGTYYSTFALWDSLTGNDKHGLYNNPLLQTASYKPLYESLAKNAGIGLQGEGVTVDYSNNPRPYWNKDYDIGAYEIQGDAQLKMGISSGTNQSFAITTTGTYWEYNISNGTFPLSSNSSYSTSTFTVSGVETNLNKWRGWDLGWLSVPNDSNKQFAQGIYKLKYINGTDTSKYIYIDCRDAISNYSPNLYIEFFPSLGQFKYYDGSTFQLMNNGDMLRIWNVNNSGTSNTGVLTNYWSNALECADSNYHPKLIWGPKNSFGGNYNIYKNGDYYGDWHIIKSTTSTSYTDLSESYVFGLYSHNVSYKILADTNNYTNIVITKVNGAPPGKMKLNVNNSKPVEYSLNQNYPNPFNPNTIIRYSIPNDGLVILKVYDILGRELETLVNETKQSGEYDVSFSGHNLASGVYIYRLTSGTYTQTKKMQFIK